MDGARDCYYVLVSRSLWTSNQASYMLKAVPTRPEFVTFIVIYLFIHISLTSNLISNTCRFLLDILSQDLLWQLYLLAALNCFYVSYYTTWLSDHGVLL